MPPDLALGAGLDLTGAAATWNAWRMSLAPTEALLTYWGAVQVTIAVVAVIILISSVDDLLVDVVYWWVALGDKFRRQPRQAALDAAEEKRIAIIVPAWRESAVIAQMLINTLSVFRYANYEIFVGVYENDPETGAEVARVAARFPTVHAAPVPRQGPTSKADCLNWVVQNIFLRERESGRPFDLFVLHDAEDVVHPFELKVVNWFGQLSGMIQLPVLSLPRRQSQWIACHYMDEFAEFHGKDLRVRSRLTGLTPSAGVATAIGRDALLALCRETGQQPFNTDSLTEDYDLAARLKSLGFGSAFVRYFARTLRYRKAVLRKGDKPVFRRELVTTQEYFPHTWSTSIRQKSRWMLGISFMGWAQLGWFGDGWTRYFLFRDRKALLTAPTGALGYLLVLQYLGYFGLATIFPGLWMLPPLVDQAWVWRVIEINLIFMAVRMAHRMWFTGKTYGPGYAPLAALRIVISNLVGFFAFVRAGRQFLAHVALKKRITWDKTQHAFPSVDRLGHRQNRLGDRLRSWNRIDADALDRALEAQKLRHRPLGLLLIDRGDLDELGIAEAFAEYAGVAVAEVDPLQIPPSVAGLMGARERAQFGAAPLGLDADGLVVALAEPLEEAALAELSRTLIRNGSVARIRTAFAPLSEVVYAMRCAREPDHLEAEKRTMAIISRLGLVDYDTLGAVKRAVRRSHARLGDLAVRAEKALHAEVAVALRAQFRGDPRPLGEALVARKVLTVTDLEALLERQSRARLDILGAAVVLGLMDVARADAVRRDVTMPETP